MAEKDNTFQNTVEALFRGMDSFITTKTVVGEAIHIEDTILLPLVDVSFGVGAGAFAENAKNNAGGGMGGKISPSAVLVISKNGTRLVNIKNQDAVTKIIDMAPDLISRFTGKKEEDGYTAEKVEHIINQEADKEEARLCRILGFLLFWMGVGLLISLMIRSSFLTVLAAALLLCVGYHLFCNTGE